MASIPSSRILRVGVIQGGKIIEERHLKRREGVTIGQDAKNTIVVPTSQLPATFGVFEHNGAGYSLVFTAAMDGRVRMGTTDLDFASLRMQGLAQQRGDHWVLPLSDDARGKISLGEITLFFQLMSPPPESAKVVLPPMVKGSFLASMDRFFLAVLGISLLLHFSGATCIVLQPPPVERELTLDELPDRFARVLIPQQIEPPKPVETAQTGDEENKDADEKKSDAGEKKADRPAPGPQNRAELEKKVASKGLLKILGSSGGMGGALEDVLGSGTGAGDIEAALAGAGGVGVATADAIGAGGPRGGGSGEAASIGELGTSGGGDVKLASKKDATVSGRVRDAAPEVDSADVDRDALARYVKARIKAIQSCYEKELKRNPTLKGKVVVRFTITPSGRANDVEIEENSVGNEAVASCIRTYIRGWVFPFKPSDDVSVAYPFVFSPAS